MNFENGLCPKADIKKPLTAHSILTNRQPVQGKRKDCFNYLSRGIGGILSLHCLVRWVIDFSLTSRGDLNSKRIHVCPALAPPRRTFLKRGVGEIECASVPFEYKLLLCSTYYHSTGSLLDKTHICNDI